MHAESELKKVVLVEGKVNFVCLRERCPSSCCGPFGGVQRGITSIEGREFFEIVLIDNDYVRIVEGGYSHLIERGRDGKHRMALLPDGSCCAFSQGRCTINKIKPSLCRAFPFYVDMFVGLCGVTVCPGFGAGWSSIEDLRDEVAAAKRMYEFWLNDIDRTSPFRSV